MKMTVKIFTIIAFFFCGTFCYGQSGKENADSCLMNLNRGFDLQWSFEIDSLLKALEMFDKVISGTCSFEIKNYSRYNKAQTLSKLDRDKEALELLKKSNYIEVDSTFMAYLHQEKYFIYMKNKKYNKAFC